ncbi:hypothetical protein BDV32DRAFT_128938 [Aspergillus pseudonomiae]|nr:hypothetical protein BDV32DRAFT_128938 [Aspergillus pseudonomiae]
MKVLYVPRIFLFLSFFLFFPFCRPPCTGRNAGCYRWLAFGGSLSFFPYFLKSVLYLSAPVPPTI